MRHLLSPEGVRALQAVMQLRPILAFDFDGTLAPIVDNPDDARVPERVTRALAALGTSLSVAIITGRRVADVRPRLGFEPQHVIGNHGAEDPLVAPPPSACDALDELRERITLRHHAIEAAGVEVEDKGLSLALHYRRAPDAGAALVCIEALLLGIEPALKRFGGKCVVNIVAAGVADKGDALVALVHRSGARSAVFFGDDVNDEAVFIRAEPQWLTVRVGRDPLSRAMFYLDSDEELLPVLEQMLAARPPEEPRRTPARTLPPAR